MSDRIVLRRVYALDPDTGGFITGGNSLITDGRGGTAWSGVLDSLSTFGGPMVSFLPSTLSSFSTICYINSSNIKVLQSQIIGLTGNTITDNLGGTYISTASLQSSIKNTVDGLGSIYISTASLQSSLRSTVEGLGSIYISTASLQGGFTSTVEGLGSSRYVSTSGLQSTVEGLGSSRYVSTSGLQSTLEGLGSSRYVSTSGLQSTVEGLGTSRYVSTSGLQSTMEGLGSMQYVSTSGLQSTVEGLGSSRYVSTSGLQSTVEGLGNSRYVSTSGLQSTVTGLGSIGYLSSLALNIRYDNATSVSIVGGSNINTFTNVGTINYVSTFFQSSMTYSGPQPGVQLVANIPIGSPYDMEFSTATIRLDSFSSFTNSNSRITIEAYPTILFTKLGNACTSPICIPISTLLKYGSNTLLYNTTTTSYLFAANGLATIGSLTVNSNVNSSNAFQQPIRISVPQNTVLNYDSNYSLYHYMPNSINNAQFQNGLHSNQFTPYYGSTGSIFVSVQNSV